MSLDSPGRLAVRLSVRGDAHTRWDGLPAFDRLDPTAKPPIAVAVSGGGDSLAALIATCDWAARCGRKVLALSVDHRLQPASAAWTAFAGRAAAELGADFQALAWTGDKPATGLPAAARLARHRLLANAARAAGCSVIVTGHTADDQAENALMGQGRLTDWSPSPVWPEGRGLFLLRPLLGVRRGDIRDGLVAAGRTWIDDPANEDFANARARARAALQSLPTGQATRNADLTSSPLFPLAGKRLGDGGAAPRFADFKPSKANWTLRADTPNPQPLPRKGEGESLGADPGLLVLPRETDRQTLAAALVCVGGGTRLPRAEAIDRLLDRLQSGDPFTATLAGARQAAAEKIIITRDPGRAGLPHQLLPTNIPTVWDGRYELTATAPGLTVRSLAGLAAKLPKAQLSALRGIPAPARGPLPAILSQDGAVTCPILAGEGQVRCRDLVNGRFLSAIGAFDDELSLCDFARMAKLAATSYLGTLG